MIPIFTLDMCGSGVFGENRFFGRVRRALEEQVVAIRVLDLSRPHPVADHRPGGVEAAATEFVIQPDGIVAQEVDRDAYPDRGGRHVAVLSFAPECLQHQRGVAELEPAPPQLPLVDPLFRELAAKAIDVEASCTFDWTCGGVMATAKIAAGPGPGDSRECSANEEAWTGGVRRSRAAPRLLPTVAAGCRPFGAAQSHPR